MNVRRSLPSAVVSYGAFLGICAVTLAAYGRSFWVPFQFDDYGHIVHNEALRAGILGDFLRFGRTRIIPFSTLALNYWLGGEATFGYHVVNFAVHLLATFAVYQLALALCRTPRVAQTWLARQSIVFAVAAAFLFACHPIQVQAVTYIVQRITAMAALFYVAAVLCYVRARNTEIGLEIGRPGRWYGGVVACALAALLSKENAASLPLALLLTEWIFYPRGPAARPLRRIVLVALLVALIPLSWWLLGVVVRAAPGAEPTERPGGIASEVSDLYQAVRFMVYRAEGTGRTPLEYLLTQCVVVPRYLRMVLLPYGFNIDHDAPIVTGVPPQAIAGAALLALLMAFGIFVRKRSPITSYGVLWVFVTLSVESSFLPIRDPMVEHRMYLAMPGIAFLVAAAFAWCVQRVPVAGAMVGVAVAAGLVLLTFERNEVWRTPLALWGDAVDQAPNKARPHVNLATALHEQGRLDQAIAHYCRALKLEPTNQQAKSNLNALVEQQVDKLAASGKEFALGGTLGPDGSIELEPRDPCEGR